MENETFSSIGGVLGSSRASYRKSYFMWKVSIRESFYIMGADRGSVWLFEGVFTWGSAPDPEIFRFGASGRHEKGDTPLEDVARAVWHHLGARVASQQSPIPQDGSTSVAGMDAYCKHDMIDKYRRRPMRRWDNVVDKYVQEYSVRGLAAGTIARTRGELDRWGTWMKRRRPKPRIEEIDAELLTRYLGERCAFRSKSTLSSTMSVMRCLGEFLVREGYRIRTPFGGCEARSWIIVHICLDGSHVKP